MRTRIAIVLSLLLSTAPVAMTAAGPFAKGELVLVTNGAPSINAGILRVDPLTGTVTQLYDITGSQSAQNTARERSATCSAWRSSSTPSTTACGRSRRAA